MKVLIVGKSGQLASELLDTCPNHIEAKAYGRDDIDIVQVSSIETVIKCFEPEVIINASAYTAVDKAESERKQAFLINETGVENLAVISKKFGIRLLHISTDFVFDGTKKTPYQVDDIPNPMSVYGASKLAGEQAISRCNPDNSTVVRTSWLYSDYGNNFVKTMLRLMKERDNLNVVNDQIACPTDAKYLAHFLWKLAVEESIAPLYHWSDIGVASWYDFALAIQKIALDKGILKKTITINPIPSNEYPTPATRPHFSLLDTSRSQLVFASGHWYERLSNFISRGVNE